MSGVPLAHQRFTLGVLRVGAYVVAAVALATVGWLVAGVPDSAFVPMITVLALAGAIALVVVGVRTRTMTSPHVVLGAPLLLSLAAAMQPITRIFGDWSFETLTVAVLITIAPLAGIAVAMLAGRWRVPRLEPGTAAMPHPRRLILVCLLMCVLASLVYAYEWSTVGGPPLLSPNIDEARFGVQFGLVHVMTQWLPLALLIATWARVARARSFTPLQRRTLEGIMLSTPVVLALGGGRGLVLLPLMSALVVAARHVSRRSARRMAVVIPIAVIVFSSAIFLARVGQVRTSNHVVGSVLYNDTGTKSSPLESTYRSVAIGLGEQLRVIAELHDGKVRTPPFTTSIWFAHNFTERAVDPQTLTGPNAGGWLASMYAGPLLLDFGVLPALLFGFILGAGAYAIYRQFALGRSVAIIWVYAYLTGPIAFAFYVNVFLQFVYPTLDIILLIVLSRMLVKPTDPVRARKR